jgi:tetratricopeptide (TPR) repeat protein
MAEKVIVKGGGTLDGAQFDNAATEATLRELIKTVKDQKCCGEGGDKKLEALANRALRENVNGLNDNTAAQESSTKNVGLLGKAATKTSSLLADGLGMLAGGMLSGVVTAGETLFKFFTDSLDAFRETSSVGASFNNDLVMLRKTAANAGMSLEDFTGMVGKNSKLMASLGGTTTKGAMAFAEMSGQIRNSEFGKNMQMTGMTTGDLNDYLSGYLEIQQRAGKIEGKIGEKERQGAESYIEEMDKMTKMTGVSRQAGQDALRTAMKDGKSLNLASKLSGQALLNFQTGLTLMNTTLDPSAMKSLTNMMSGVIDPGDRFAKMLTQASPGIMDFQRAMGKGQLSAEQQVRGYKQQEKSIDNYLSKFSDEQIARDANLTQLREYQASLKRYKTMNYDDAVKEQKANNALTKAVASFGQIFQTIKGKILGAMLESKVFEKFEKVLQQISDKFNQYAPMIGDFLADFIDGIDKAFTGEGTLMDGISAAFSSMFAKLTPIVKDLFGGLFRSLADTISGKGKQKEDLKTKIKKKDASMSDGFSPEDTKELNALKAQLDDLEKEDPFENLTKSLKEMFPIIGQIQGAVATVTDLFKNWGTTILAGGGIIVALGALNALIGGAGKGLGKAIGGLGEGIGTLIGSIGKGLGTAIGGILTGVGKGLAFLGEVAGPMVIGAGALGIAIGLIGTGIAGATWIIGKALPTFAEGMAAFQNLNGDNLIKVGAGIGAIGVAMAAMGVGSAVGGIGNMLGGLADGITSLFGGKTPFDKLQEFSKYDIDTEKVKSNSQALVAYSTAMAALGAGGAIGSLGGLVSGVADGLIKMFGGNPIPWAKIQEFQTITLDGDKIEKNSNAVVAYMKAMASLSAGNAIGSLGGLVSAVADGLTKFFGGNIKLPWDRMIEFQNVALNMEKIGRNSEAVIAFSKAISNLPDIKTESSGGVVGAIGSFFSGSQVMPWDKMIEFQNVALNIDKIGKNSDAVIAFSKAMSNLPDIKTESSGGVVGAIGSFFSGSQVMPWDKLKEFGEVKLDADKIGKNSDAVVAYGKAMAALGAGGAIGSLGGLVSAVADGLTGLFGRDPIPWNQMIAFQNVQLDGATIEKNSMAVVAYMKAMATLGAGNVVGSLGGLVSAVADGLTKFFGGNIKLPWDKMIEFQNVALDIDKIGKNSDAIIAFSKAMSSLPDIKTETSGGAFSYIGSFFSGSQVMPWDKLKEFGEVKLDADKIKNNADILKLFGDSVKTFSSAGTSSITNVGTDFATQATGINTFTDSIKNLNKAIIDLNASLATIASSGKGLLGGGQSNLSVVSQALGGANTGSSAASEKLNTLVAELVALTKEIKDSSKDQADALKGRKDAL